MSEQTPTPNNDPFHLLRSYIGVLETAERTERDTPTYPWFEMCAIRYALETLTELARRQERRDRWQRAFNELVIFRLNIEQEEIDALESDKLLTISVSGEQTMPNLFAITLTGQHSISGLGPLTTADGVTVTVASTSNGGSEVYNVTDAATGTVTGENPGGTFTLSASNADGSVTASQAFTWGAAPVDKLTSIGIDGIEQPAP